MTEKELQRLNRKELLEIMLSQAQEIEDLKEEIASAGRKPAIEIQDYPKSASLAENALSVSGVYEDAQLAAERYIEEIRNLKARTEARRGEIIRAAEEEAQRMISESVQKNEEKMRRLNEYTDSVKNKVKTMCRENPEIWRYIMSQRESGRN